MRRETTRVGLAHIHVLVLVALALTGVGARPARAGQLTYGDGRGLDLPDLYEPVSHEGEQSSLSQTLLPEADAERVSVGTEAELAAAAKTVGQKATIVLTSDIVLATGPLCVVQGADFILDLNGHTLSRELQAADSDGNVIQVGYGARLSVVDHGPNRQGTISGGWVSGYGGGILNDGTLSMVGGTVSGNRATVAGAGIANRGEASFTSTTIANNTCRNDGGGIFCERDATIALSGCYLENNEADEGGGIYLNRLASAVRLMGCHIVGNRARVGGGLFDFVWPDNDQATLAVVSTAISQNVATEDGGAIYGTAAFGHDTGPTTPPLTLDSNSQILNNRAGGRGGGLFLEKRYVAKACDVKISGNECAASGGGIFVDGAAEEAGSLQMEGYVKVEGNLRVMDDGEGGRTSEGSNVCFASDDNVIRVTGPFDRRTHVVVTFDVLPLYRTVTKDYEKKTSTADGEGDGDTPDPDQFFSGDNDRAAVLKDGEVRLARRVHYVDEGGADQAIVDYQELAADFTGTKGEGGWFVVARDMELAERPVIDAKAALVVCDGATLTCGKGIEVPKSGSLVMYGQERQTGSVVADARDVEHAAGIGSSEGGLCGKMTFNGADVEAYGGSQGAGIGCGGNWSPDRYDFEWNVSGPIIVNRGRIRACGGSSGAGVGHGIMNLDYDFDQGRPVVSERAATLDVQVHGGKLEAVGGTSGPGIGVTSKAGFTFTVDGGEVIAAGGTGGAGIGSRIADFCYDSKLTFAGGWVQVGGGTYMPGIGFRKVDFTSFDRYAGPRDSPRDTMTFSGATVEIYTADSGYQPMDGPFQPSSTGDTMVLATGSSGQPERVPDERRWQCLEDREVRYVCVEPCDHLHASATQSGDDAWELSCEWCEADEQGEGWPVHYEAGEGTGQMRDGFVVLDADGDAYLTLPETTTFEGPRGTELVAWRVDGTEHAPGDAVRIEGEVTAVAVWRTTWAGVQRYLLDAKDTDDALVLDVDLVAGAHDKALRVPAGVRATIDLNGHTIDRNLDTPRHRGSVLRVEGDLTLIGDGVIRGGYNASTGDAAGGGISVAAGASVRVAGPTVSGNRARSGGGVHTRGTFVVEAGDVTGNVSYGLGAKGGGGGVTVDGGSFTLFRDGRVSDNSAKGNGGGVMLRAGTLRIDGGSVRGNEAAGAGGGVLVGPGTTIALSGCPSVKDNTAAGAASNVFLHNPETSPLEVEGLLDMSEVGVQVTDEPYVGRPVRITRGLGGKDPKCRLASDDADHILDLSPEGEAVLGLPVTVSFDAGGEATGEMGPVVCASGGVLEVPECDFCPVAGCGFVGWRLGDQVLRPGQVITAMTDMTLTALWSDAYPVWVTGMQVSDSNKDDVLGDGTVSYDAETNTLTLEGFRRVSPSGRDAIIDADGVDLTVTGSGTIGLARGHATRAIEVRDGSLRIGGDLDIEGGACAIYAEGDITFTHGSMGVVATDPQGTGVCTTKAGATITVEEAVVRLEVTAGRHAFEGGLTPSVIVADGLRVEEPQDASLTGPHVLIVREGTDVWGEPRYVWHDGYGTVSATRRRQDVPSLTETETVTTSARVTKAATCTEVGETTYTAHFANAAFETQVRTVANIAATGHVPAAEELRENLVPATCVEAGSYDSVAVCRVCGQELARTRESLAPLGHDWDEGQVTVEPTCTDAGYVTYTCGRDASHTKGTELPCLGHAWGDWSVSTPATDTGHGLQVRICEHDASHVDRRSIPRRGHIHALVRVDGTDPGCLEAGVRQTWVCKAGDDPCHLAFLDEAGEVAVDDENATVAARGHVLDAGVVTVEPACNLDGVRTRTCEVCGATVDEPLERTLHDTEWVDEPIVEPTCAGPGYLWHTLRCRTCGEPMTKSLVAGEALGHVYPAQASREHGVAATCTEPGTVELVRRCERCGMELSRTSEATRPLGHEWTEPTYAWAPDARSVTATRTCARDEAHVEKETATVSSTVIREPSGTADGIELLAATFENSAFATQERRVTIPATGGKEGTSSETEGPLEGDGRHNKEVVVALPGVFGARPYGSGPAFGRIPGNAIFDHGPQRTWYDGGTTDELASRRSTAEVPFAGGSPTPVQTPTTSTTGTDVAPPTGVVPTTGIQATGPAVPSAATGTTAGAGVRAQTVATGKVATQSLALPGTADTSDDGLACGFVVCALAMSVAGVRRLRPERA